MPATSTVGSWRSNRSLRHLASVRCRPCVPYRRSPLCCWQGNATAVGRSVRDLEVCVGRRGWPRARGSSPRTGTGTHAVPVEQTYLCVCWISYKFIVPIYCLCRAALDYGTSATVCFCVGHGNVENWKWQERFIFFFFFLLSHLRTMRAAAGRQQRF